MIKRYQLSVTSSSKNNSSELCILTFIFNIFDANIFEYLGQKLLLRECIFYLSYHSICVAENG